MPKPAQRLENHEPPRLRFKGKRQVGRDGGSWCMRLASGVPHERSHPRRAPVARKAHRALDPLRPASSRTDSRSPATCPVLHARQHLCLRPLGRQRLRHHRVPHRHPAHGTCRCSVRDRSVRASGWRHSAADLRLGEGPAGAADDRYRRRGWCRPGGRCARLLASRT